MYFKNIFFALPLLVFLSAGPQQTQAQPRAVNFQIFYDELSPYGSWIQSPDYGYVWLPNVDAGFNPYSSNGYWILTDEGWAWVSNYSWGWAPFHYGRWYSDAIYGFMWIPDNVWGPAWVNWRSSPDYYGWAPMGPSYGSGFHEHQDRWTFVHGRRLGDRNIHRYYMNNRHNTNIYNHTTDVDNHPGGNDHGNYNAGPFRKDVEKRQGRAIIPVQIKDNDKPGQRVNKQQLEIYRPQVEKSTTSAPAKVGSLRDVKTREQRLNDRKTNPAATKPARPAKTNQAPANQPIQRNMPANKPPTGTRQKQTDPPGPTSRQQPQNTPENKANSRMNNPTPRQQPQPAPENKANSRMNNPSPRQQPRQAPANAPNSRMNNPAPRQQQQAPENRANSRMNNPTPRQQPQAPQQRPNNPRQKKD